jgi:hypothetical protein
MKTLLVLATLVLAAASSAFANEIFPPSATDLLPFGGNVHARVGMSRSNLVAQIGEPTARLGEGVWAYWDFRRAGQLASDRGDTLVVVFAGDRVSLLRFTTRSAVEAALRQMRANAAVPATIAKR